VTDAGAASILEHPRWAAVIVNYEAGELLVQCVRSVLADQSAGPVELVVVDNASQDASVERLRTAFPDVRVVRAPRNVGYARAANLGIAATYASVVAVLNADLTVAPGTASALVGRLETDTGIGAIGPRVRNLDGSDYPSARNQPSVGLAVGHGLFGLFWPSNPFTRRYRQLDADPSRARVVDWLSGSAMWFRRDALDAVGAWDERYFMYMEDLDLCWRLRRDGWRVEYEPAAAVTHVQGASTSRHPYRMLLEHHRSAWRFARRRFQGPHVVLLPFAAIYLGFRAVLALGEHAWRANRAARAR
jgi:N-acetylglucosaminyl-diphospho-decaprenol L-rhamnosyltransferase